MDKNNLLINLEDISYAYPGGSQVLRNLSFQLHHKERLGLIGPNGSGKTTLFHVIMGLLQPTSGKIEIFGNRLTDEKDFRPVRQQIGLLFQDADDQLFSPTVLEDVAFGPLNQGKPIRESKDIARDTLSSLGLEGFENRITYKLKAFQESRNLFHSILITFFPFTFLTIFFIYNEIILIFSIGYGVLDFELAWTPIMINRIFTK